MVDKEKSTTEQPATKLTTVEPNAVTQEQPVAAKLARKEQPILPEFTVKDFLTNTLYTEQDLLDYDQAALLLEEQIYEEAAMADTTATTLEESAADLKTMINLDEEFSALDVNDSELEDI